jgi:hypothetical protein
MPALIAGMVARFTFRRQAKLARCWQQLIALTPDALPFCDRYVEELSDLWFEAGPNNCYTYANCTRRRERQTDGREPGGCAKVGKSQPLQQRLQADGWLPGRPTGRTEGAHICVAFEEANAQVPGLVDYHFYRLGPDGWSHRLGDNAATPCDNPFVDARRLGFHRFQGWWTVPHSPEANLVVANFFTEAVAARGLEHLFDPDPALE